MPPKKDPQVTVSMEDLRAMIREEIQAAIARDVQPEFQRINDELKAITAIKQEVEDLKVSLDFASRRIDDLYTTTVPALAQHVSDVATALSLRLLDIDVHRRKWSLSIQGLKGAADEDEDVTRTKCVELATAQLKVENASVNDFSACHWLKTEADAAIIVRFKDLKMRNSWLSNAKNLKNTDFKDVSISPDLPPIIRCLKSELLDKRRLMNREDKANASLRYLRSWPYVQLNRKNREPLRPTKPLADIVNATLDRNALFIPTEPTHA